MHLIFKYAPSLSSLFLLCFMSVCSIVRINYLCTVSIMTLFFYLSKAQLAGQEQIDEEKVEDKNNKKKN